MLLGFNVSVYAETLVLTPAKDNTLFEDNVNYSGGVSSFTFFGPIASGSPRRTLWQFDVSSIPSGAQIHSVSVKFVVSRAAIGSSPDDVATLHRLNASWGEGNSDSGTGGGGTQATPEDATWAYRFYGNPGAGIPRTPWVNPGGDYQASASATIPVGGIGNYTFSSTVQMVNDVSAWVNNPSSNHGWILIGAEGGELSQKAKRIVSRESPSITERPTLTVDFTRPSTSPVAVPLLPEFGLSVFGLMLVIIGHRLSTRPS